MKIETFAVCHNEERILPYFLRHYLQYGSVTIFDNYSTDNSMEILKNFNVNIFQFDSGGEFREDILTHIRNVCWKESKADWCFVVDVDEFIYHPNLIKILETIEGTVILPRMFNMYSDVFPTTEGQIYDEVQHGVEFNSKMSIFRPAEISEMNYEPGMHFANPKGNYNLNFISSIIELHFKNLSQEYVNEKNAYLHARQSEIARINGWNWHYAATTEQVAKDFLIAKTKLIKVV
jgi:glycosyltransferase involved in cell wall biosynthesis